LVRALELAGAPRPAAEDVAQEAFARMLTHWRRVRTGSNPAGYAYRTAFRLLSRSRRSRQVPTLTVAPEAGRAVPGGSVTAPAPVTVVATALLGARAAPVLVPSPPPEQTTPGPEGVVTTRAAVASALAAMPPRRRACAVMGLVVGLSTSEVSSALGIAEGTVRKHLGEAREDLRRFLAS
jgi:RNA polymerase sigma factor (sigma-70 family)